MPRINQRERAAHRRTILSMLETTPATVARAPTGGQPAGPIPDLDFDWRPHPLDRTVTARRTYRWPIVVGAVIVGLGVLAGVKFGLAVPAHNASLRQAEYRTAVDAYEAALDHLQSAVTATDPQAAAEFATATGALRAVAEAPLPWVPPLIPLGPDLGPARVKLLELVDTAVTLSDEIARAARYSEASTGILALPLLPYTVPTQLIDPAAKALADMEADSQAGIATLDDDPAYEPYRLGVEAAMASLPDWIDRYLLALRNGDTEAATTLIDDLQARTDLARAELDAVFADVDADADAGLTTLRAGLEAIRVLAG
ncbi:MAG: hypothetical protein V1757_11500 [Actinomycetota bacterium]